MTDWLTNRQTDIHVGRQIDRQTDIHVDRQTDRQVGRQKTQTDREAKVKDGIINLILRNYLVD